MRQLIIFMFILIFCPLLFAEDNNIKEQNILIVSDKDGLEWNVADYLETHFTDNGFKVNNILISECTKNDYACHGIVILMSVIEDNKIPISLQNKMQKYQNTRDENNEETIFFISTIIGDEWDNKKRVVDGITSASEMDDAEPIAKRIIEKIELKLGITK